MSGVEVIDISLRGGPPWGLRLFGGNGEPLMLSKIRKQSEASDAGLQEGDVLIAINGYSCDNMSHSAAMQLIDSAGDSLTFMIVRGGCSADDIRRTLQSASGSLKTLSERRSSGHAPMTSSVEKPAGGGFNGVHGSGGHGGYGGISSSTLGGLAEPGLSYLPQPTGPRPAGTWTPKVTAPAGVSVTQHQDRSITLGLGLGENKENTTPARPSFLAPNVKADVGQAVWRPSATPALPPIRLPINDDFEDSSYQHDVIADDSTLRDKPNNLLLSRIANEGGVSEGDSGPESPGYAQRKKKVFADSAFYDDASSNYPTIDEQIKMAHLVAQQLMAPANKRARGHQMFMKRRQRADRWVAGAQQDGSDDEGDDKYYQADPWKHGGGGAWQPKGQGLSAGGLDGGLPAGIWSAQVVPEGGKETKAMSAEEIERMRLYSQKNEHTGVSPQMCFNIANDLKNMKGRGGKIFAKRQARSDKWVHDGGDSGQVDDPGHGQGPVAPVASTRPNKDFMAKLEGTIANRKPPGEEGSASKGPAPATAPRNRLKEMIDPPKAKMTPWDAWAEYGSLEPAFEHLPNYFKQRDALAADDDQPSPAAPSGSAFPASSGGAFPASSGGAFPAPSSTPGFSAPSSTPAGAGFSATGPASAPLKPVHFAPSAAASAGFSAASSGNAPVPAAKPAGFRPVRFNMGGGDGSSLQSAPPAVDVGFCDL